MNNLTDKIINNMNQEPENEERFSKATSDDTLIRYGVIGTEKKKIWVFNSGDIFAGNPKWLFVYINKYRPDIKAFWLCGNEDTVSYINSLGYKAFLFSSKEGIEIATASGVYVTEQCKEVIPENLKNCVCLNLYHGVGCKSIERKVASGFLFDRIMKKYIVHNEFYLNNMLFLVTSPLMEEHFKKQVGVADDMVIRAGYPRCVYQQYYERVETFDHDILKAKGRNADTKVIVYAPTYRDNPDFCFVDTLLPDMAALEQKLADNNQLLIFKLHPLMQNDKGFQAIYEKYADSPYFLFWNNENDIYEIFDRIDTAIIDYSSIFYDFLAGGVRNFIRYFADYGTADLRDNVFDYKEMTCGRICSSFEELLEALDSCESDEEEKKDRQRIDDLFWEYSGEDTMEKIIEATLAFKIKKQPLPKLYTFDVFDTLVSRKGLDPASIFCKVKEQAASSGLGFSRFFIDSYIDLRKRCEANVREFWKKTTYVRNSELREISFDSIFERMKTLYGLSEEQVAFLKERELEAEFEDCVAVPEMIAFAELLVERGDDVMIISDMYLPSAFIKKLIGKFSETLTKVPMYVSCEYGVQKSTGLLFREVYKDIDFYRYGEWFHYGDNRNADSAKPAAFGIKPKLYTAPVLNEYENSIIKALGTYDAYLVAAAMARFRKRNKSSRDYFSYAYVSLCLVPYIMWVIDDAQKRNLDTLYFISRDGYHLKRIADVVLSKLGINIKAKYIYGSRKAWRIPSFIREFDESFFLPFGNLATSANYNDLLSALSLDDEKFDEFFPSLCDLKFCEILTAEQRKTAISVIEKSEEYRDYLLAVAAKDRVNVEKYLKQEIDFDEKFAFADYWGRGYTQTCLTRLVQDIVQQEVDVPFYYVRSIYPTQGHNVRYNYTSKNTSMLFVEALFSNIDYKSIPGYSETDDGKMIPIIEPENCDMQLFYSMKSKLCCFAEDFLDLDLIDRNSTLRSLLDYSFEYFNSNPEDPFVVEYLAPLGCTVTMFEARREFAPKLTKEDVEMIADKKVSVFQITYSLKMSLARSDEDVVEYYEYLTKQRPKELKKEDSVVKKSKKMQIKDSSYRLYNQSFDQKAKEENKKYAKMAKAPVENKIVIINVYDDGQAEFESLISIYEKNGFEVKLLPLRGTYTGDKLRSLATAKYIFMSDISGWFSRVKFRKETKLIQFYRQPFPIDGMTQMVESDASEDKKKRVRNIHAAVFSLVSCIGDNVGKIYSENYVNKENVKVTKPLGNPLTDVYFSSDAQEKIRERLSEKINLNNKKILAYFPSKAISRKSVFDYLDLSKLKNLCSDEYVVLVFGEESQDIIRAFADSLGGFALDCSQLVTQRELMSIADVIVGDCTGVLLEGVLTGKPIYFTSKYTEKENGLSLFSQEEIFNVPFVEDAQQLYSLLNSEEEYPTDDYTAFRNRYFEACDGHSAERIFEYLKTLEEPESR